MCKYYSIFAAVVLFFSQQIFADMPMDPTQEGPCKNIAKACLSAGYSKHGDMQTSKNKHIWFDCMKPIELGQTVQGVTVNSSDVTTCRQNMIDKLQKDLNDLQQAQANNTNTNTTTVTQ